MANGAFNFKNNSGNIVSFISGSGSDIIISGGTLNLSNMTGLTLGNLTMEGTVETASFAPSYLLTSSFNTYSGITNTVIGTLQTSTGSLNSFTSSTSGRLNSIEGVTGSYATTGSNTFNGNLTVTGYIDAQELRTTYISSSILYRSGSTKFGDELTDTHAFTGSMLLSGSLITTGNMGVGTGSPVTFGTRNLDVNAGSGGAAYIVARANNNAGTIEIAFDTDAGYLSTKSNHPLIIRTNDAERMRITSGGHVGIKIVPNSGWGSAMAALQIGTGGVIDNWTGTDSVLGVGVNYYDNGSGAQIRLYAKGASKIGFSQNVISFSNVGADSAGSTITWAERMSINADGNLRINNFTTNGLVGTNSSGTLGVVNLTYTEIATGTISYSNNSGASWGINNSFPATIRNYEDEGMAGSAGVATNLNLNRGVTFDLGSSKAVRKIVERGYSTKNLDTIQVQYSTDNSNWTTIHTYRHVYGNTQKDMEFNPTGAISARYWRWLIDGWTEREVQNYYTYESIIYT